MSRRSLSTLLVLTAVLAVGVVWLERRGKKPSSATVGEVDAPRSEPFATRPGSASPSLAATEEPEANDPEVVPTVDAKPHETARESVAPSQVDHELAAGIWIEGRVVFPPGTPADERVEIVAEGRKFQSRPLHRVPVASDGTFRVAFANRTGMGSLALVARYLYLDNQRTMWLADGKREVVLRPKLGGRIQGRLILPPLTSAQRNLVVGCRVGASVAPDLDEWSSGASPTDVRAGTVDENLEFAVDGLPDLNRYFVTARPIGMIESRLKTVSVEAGRTLVLDIEIQEGASASGVVMAPTGELVRGARVWLSWADWREVEWRLRARENQDTVTDSEGRFELLGIRPGVLELTASAKGWVRSQRLTLEALPAQKLSDLVIMLSHGGRIVGQVIDASGQPRASCSVRLQGRTSHSYSSATTDAQGRFEAGSLVPDTYWVTAVQEEPVVTTFASATIGVKDGETVEVVLGRPSEDGIRVLGKITMDGSPVAGCSVTAGRTSTWDPRMAETSSNAEGKYELAVLEPGHYSFTVEHATGNTSRTELLTITEGSVFEHDVELPAGRISGRVLDSDGAPRRDVEVTVALESRPELEVDGRSYGHVATDESGRFVFDGLSQGTYRVDAGNGHLFRVPGRWRIAGPRSSVGTASQPGIELAEGARLEGIELRLQPGCHIEGRATGPDGRPVRGATVYVRDEAGRVLNEDRNCRTDSLGLFEISDLPTGTMTLSACTLDMASPESEPRLLPSGGTFHVELALRKATVLRVLVLQGDRRITGAFIFVTDERGRVVPMERSVNFGVSEEPGQRVGPLCPGQYSVTATTSDGKVARGEVQVTGGAEESMVLRIAD